MEGWLPIVAMIVLSAAAFTGGLFASNFLLGPKNPTPEKSAPYECGMPAVGDARERQSVKFYLVAMIFLLFDIEVAFLYPWAMALRDLRLGRVLPDPRRSSCSCRSATSTSGARACSTGASKARSGSSEAGSRAPEPRKLGVQRMPERQAIASCPNLRQTTCPFCSCPRTSSSSGRAARPSGRRTFGLACCAIEMMAMAPAATTSRGSAPRCSAARRGSPI